MAGWPPPDLANGTRGRPPEALALPLLAAVWRLPARAIGLTTDIDHLLSELVAAHEGPIVSFAPSRLASALTSAFPQREHVPVWRGFGRDAGIDVELASDLPHDAIAVIDSPSDPLGALLPANDAVRLARSCRWLIVDERFADFAGQSMATLASEFPNVIVIRSLRAWTSLSAPEPGWFIASPQARRALPLDVAAVASPAWGTASTALCRASAMQAALAQAREERSRLFRSLRKLSSLQPLPSWGPFVAARVEVGSRETLLAALLERGIAIHAPAQAGLERYVRIGVGERWMMEQLRKALLEIAPLLLGDPLPAGGGHPDCFPLGREEFRQPQLRQIEQRAHPRA
ncbi:MAG: aminotransferase class I/II-fold pyridoxal phosphate-dependent enzyme [Thermomicrobiales bacterium]